MNNKDRSYNGGTLCKAFLSDFDKLEEAKKNGKLDLDDEQVRKIEEIRNNLLHDCK